MESAELGRTESNLIRLCGTVCSMRDEIKRNLGRIENNLKELDKETIKQIKDPVLKYILRNAGATEISSEELPMIYTQIKNITKNIKKFKDQKCLQKSDYDLRVGILNGTYDLEEDSGKLTFGVRDVQEASFQYKKNGYNWETKDTNTMMVPFSFFSNLNLSRIEKEALEGICHTTVRGSPSLYLGNDAYKRGIQDDKITNPFKESIKNR